jgi:glycosyltransferase involved in cell wall biosynthesis
MSKTILVIACHFPPNASSGTFRTLKFVKYLPSHGWSPVVLTMDPRHEPVEPMDSALCCQIPAGVPVIRTYAWVPSGPRAFAAMKAIAFPDPRCGWFPFAVVAGWRAIRRHHVDVIYTSGPPFTGTLVGLTLSRLTGKPLVSDFRDPWGSQTYGRQELGHPQSWRERLAQTLQRKTWEQSSCVINVSSDLTARARDAVPSDVRSRFVTIFNGFDPDDFSFLPPRPADGKVRIIHSGTLYEGMREPRQFLMALRIMADRCPAELGAVEAWFIGDKLWLKSNANWYEGLGLGNHVCFKSFVPHQESLKLLRESDILLMIGSVKAQDTGNIPAKLFEYAATRRPILSLVHEGESAEFTRGYGMGRVANPEDPEEIARVLLAMLRDVRAGTFPSAPNGDFLRRYDRRELTLQLAEVLDAVAGRK